MESDALGVSLGASILHVRDRMWFPRNEAPVNAAMQSIVFTSEILTSAETCYSNMDK